MKKLMRLIAGVVLAASMSLAPRVVGAQTSSSCTISNTGTNSNNTCTFNNNNTVTVTCENGVKVSTSTVQTANSGTATVNGNTLTGNVSSGDAANVSAVATDLAAFCAEPAAANPPVGGQGGGAPVAEAGGAGAGAVTALPKTGTSDVVRNVSLAVLATGVVGAGAHLAVSAYRRRIFNL